MRPLGQDGMRVNRCKQRTPSLSLEFAAPVVFLLIEALKETGLVGGELFHLFENLMNLGLKLVRKHVALVCGQDRRDREIEEKPHHPAEYDDHQQ